MNPQIEWGIPAGFPNARAGELYAADITINLNDAETPVAESFTKLFPTPNWLIATMVPAGLPSQKILRLSGVPDMDGQFVLSFSVHCEDDSDWYVEDPDIPAHELLILPAQYNPILLTDRLVGSKNYVLEPGDQIGIGIKRIGDPSFVIDPDMTWENPDVTNSWMVGIQSGGKIVGIPPAFTSTPPSVVYINEEMVYNVTTSGTAPISYGMVSGPGGMVVQPATGRLTWVPTELGNFDARVRAANIAGVEDQNMTVSVTAIPTVITSVLPTDLPGGVLYTLQLLADGSIPIIWNATIDPVQPSFGVSPTGLLTWLPPVVVAPEDYDIEITAVGPGGTDVKSFTVTVTP